VELIIGSHVSFKEKDGLLGSVKEALSYDSNAFMFYTGAPQNTYRKSIDLNLVKEAYELMEQNNILKENVVIHAPYIINLANNNVSFNCNFLKEEINRVITLGFKKLVIHPGSYTSLTKEEGINNIIACLNECLFAETDIFLLLETMAGKGTEIGSELEDLKYIIDRINYPEKVGICLDTCHLSDAGYDLKTVVKEAVNFFGKEKIGCIHINDSKNDVASHKDRHENIGFGTLGFDNLIDIIYDENLKDIPKILETPYIGINDDSKDRLYPPYKFEIEMIKNKVFDIELKQKIRDFYV
jgi:deoxyribonuclease-4